MKRLTVIPFWKSSHSDLATKACYLLEHDARKPAVEAHQAHLRLLQTTDMHVNLLPYDYYVDAPTPRFGLARTASLVRRHRAAARNSLLFDNGDFLQGTPLSDMIAEQHARGEAGLHPAIAAMNALGYDAGTLGNHEFNYGVDFLEHALRGAAFPVVSANITDRRHGDDRHLVAPWVILERDLSLAGGARAPIRIGVIGFAPPQIEVWDAIALRGQVATGDILAAARDQVPQLRAAGADIVIALSHSGIGDETAQDRMENASVPLAGIDGIDVILAGHMHKCFPGPDFDATDLVDPALGTLHGKPAVMAGFHGSHLGVIDLVVEPDGSGWRIARHASSLEAICEPETMRPAGRRARVLSDAGVIAAVGDAHDQTLDHVRREVGRTTGPLQSYFARVANDGTVQLVADAQRLAAQTLIDGTAWADLPLLSAAAPFKAGGQGGPENYVDIPAGPLAIRHAADLYLFPNLLALIEVNGAQLADWLERSASAFHRVVPQRARQALIDMAFPAYCFDVIDGVTYDFDLSAPARFTIGGRVAAPAATRVRNLCHEGRPVAPDDRFVVVTNSYRIGGGCNFPIARDTARIMTTTVPVRDTLIDHFRENPALIPYRRDTWGICPVPGASAEFRTGPGALHHVNGVRDRRLTVLGEDDEGWTRMVLDLDP